MVWPCFLVFPSCVGKRWGEEQEWRKMGKREPSEPERCIWVPGPRRIGTPHPWVQCLSAYWPRRGGCQAWNIHPVTFHPQSPWDKQSPWYSVCIQCFAPDSSSFPSQWQTIQTRCGRGHPTAENVGNGQDTTEGVQAEQPNPRAMDLEESAPFQSNSAAQAPPAMSQAWDFCLDAQNKPCWPTCSG